MLKNNITRLLEQRNIIYTAFELPAEKLGALEAAQILGVDTGLVFKTIVVLREIKGKPILALVPGDREVDLKAVAAAVGEKRVRLPSEREAEQVTGLQAGGISPLALINRGFQVLLDSSAKRYDLIYISGGQRGLNIRLAPEAIITLTQARWSEITRELI